MQIKLFCKTKYVFTQEKEILAQALQSWNKLKLEKLIWTYILTKSLFHEDSVQTWNHMG